MWLHVLHLSLVYIASWLFSCRWDSAPCCSVWDVGKSYNRAFHLKTYQLTMARKIVWTGRVDMENMLWSRGC
jgi:hypothetical protein